MADTNMKARIVRVQREEGKTGLFYATSPDLKGLLIAEPTVDELDLATPKAIADLYAAVGLEVVVSRIEEEPEDLRSWVAFPAAVARKALAKETSRAE